jgi:cobalamin biosynthesis Mg chelatase CobN
LKTGAKLGPRKKIKCPACGAIFPVPEQLLTPPPPPDEGLLFDEELAPKPTRSKREEAIESEELQEVSVPAAAASVPTDTLDNIFGDLSAEKDKKKKKKKVVEEVPLEEEPVEEAAEAASEPFEEAAEVPDPISEAFDEDEPVKTKGKKSKKKEEDDEFSDLVEAPAEALNEEFVEAPVEDAGDVVEDLESTEDEAESVVEDEAEGEESARDRRKKKAKKGGGNMLFILIGVLVLLAVAGAVLYFTMFA